MKEVTPFQFSNNTSSDVIFLNSQILLLKKIKTKDDLKKRRVHISSSVESFTEKKMPLLKNTLVNEYERIQKKEGFDESKINSKSNELSELMDNLYPFLYQILYNVVIALCLKQANNSELDEILKNENIDKYFKIEKTFSDKNIVTSLTKLFDFFPVDTSLEILSEIEKEFTRENYFDKSLNDFLENIKSEIELQKRRKKKEKKYLSNQSQEALSHSEIDEYEKTFFKPHYQFTWDDIFDNKDGFKYLMNTLYNYFEKEIVPTNLNEIELKHRVKTKLSQSLKALFKYSKEEVLRNDNSFLKIISSLFPKTYIDDKEAYNTISGVKK